MEPSGKGQSLCFDYRKELCEMGEVLFRLAPGPSSQETLTFSQDFLKISTRLTP